MKKLAIVAAILVSLLIIVLASGVFFYRRITTLVARPAELLPGDTIFLAEVMDLGQTLRRWPGSELFQLTQEPEVKAFLDKPLSHLDGDASYKQFGSDLVRALPRQGFFAVQTLNGNAPAMLGGFSFAGSEAAAERLLAEPRRDLKRKHPAGRSGLVKHGGAEIQTYTDGSFTLAETFHRRWYLAASSTELLETALDRLDHADPKKPAAAGTLGADDVYRRTIAPLPSDPELRLFARTGVLLDRLSTAMMGLDSAGASLQELQALKAVAASSKLEGARWRDSFFTLKDQLPSEKPPVIGREALSLTNPDTAVFYDSVLDLRGLGQIPAQTLETTPGLAAAEEALQQHGSSLRALPKMLRDEVTLILQNGKAGPPKGVIALPLRDSGQAGQLLASLTQPGAGAAPWTIDQRGAVPVYTPSGGLPAVALKDNFALLSWSSPSLSFFLQRPSEGAQLDSLPAYREAATRVQPPASAFGYLDVAALFDAAYAWARPVLALTLAGNASSSEYIDAGKLPSSSAISKHLGVTVISTSHREEGDLWESVGNLSTAQVVVASGGALVQFITTSPLMQAAFSNLPNMLHLGGGALPGATAPLPEPAAAPSTSAEPPPAAPAPQPESPDK